MRDCEPEQPMRIAVIGGRGMPSDYSGIERIWEELYPLLAARGHAITAYCRPGVIDAELGMHKGVRLVTTPAPGPDAAQTLSHTRASILHAARCGDVHAGGKPFDLVALHALPPQWFVPLAKRLGLTVASHVHGLDWQRAKWKNAALGIGSCIIRAGERRMVREADAISVCAENLRDYYQTAYGKAVDVIPNGVVPDGGPATPCREPLDVHGLVAGRYVVSVGRIVPEKRIEDSIIAFLQAVEHQPALADCKLAIAGTGSGQYMDEIRRQADRSNGRVKLVGHLGANCVDGLFRLAAAYVTSSELEGLPSSVCEAMERSTPIVASDIPPHRQLLETVAHHGLLFPVGDAAASAERLRRVLLDRDLADTVAAEQKRHIRAHYSWPVLAGRFESFYREVVASRGVASRAA